MRYECWIDRGGTFTDCLVVDRLSQSRKLTKVLSSDGAPLIGIRKLLGLSDEQPIPPCDIYMGTTIATNALLERKGASTALVVSKGFQDLLLIGDQSRPDLFDLAIPPRAQLYQWVFEVEARLDPKGHEVERPTGSQLDELARKLAATGADSIALVVLHSYSRPSFESELKEALGLRLTTLGLSPHIYCSSGTLPEQGLLGRAGATVIDAYVSPLIEAYLQELQKELPGSRLQLMQSAGGLAYPHQFRGPQAILSGPAGGVVAAERVARQVGSKRLVSLDMGGTSTDIAVIEQHCPLRRETVVDGISIRTPMLDIHTIASGGGSVCDFDGYRLTVGPHSVGARPGPLCYGLGVDGTGGDGKSGAGRKADGTEVDTTGPRDSVDGQVAITDVNMVLGRMSADFFPFELHPAASRTGLKKLAQKIEQATGKAPSIENLALDVTALVTVQMAEAIRSATLGRGLDVRSFDILAFGGAAGQHVCGIARYLGIGKIIIHRLSGVMSAYGIGQADTLFQIEQDAGRVTLDEVSLPAIQATFRQLEKHGENELVAIMGQRRPVRTQWLELRYKGTESCLPVSLRDLAETKQTFHAEHFARFGYDRPDTSVEAVTLRLQLRWPKDQPDDEAQKDPIPSPQVTPPRRESKVYLSDRAWHTVPVHYLEDLPPGSRLLGPALVLDPTGTLFLEQNYELTLNSDLLILKDLGAPKSLGVDKLAQLSILSHRFMAIASQMGEALRRSASSTNIRDRLDFSCALFDPRARLVANAPHIPVHLGAMSATVRAIAQLHPQMRPGDSYVSNDPALGGSHLPDITVITPVFDDHGELLAYTASRGHHADIGGTTPGSMPPDSTRLEEEGVVLSGVPLVKGGKFLREDLLQRLSQGSYPARNPEENLADLSAQLAANQLGARLLRELSIELTQGRLLSQMSALHELSARWVRDRILELEAGTRTLRDEMDDGTRIQVQITVAEGKLTIDFGACSDERDNNLNSPYAVTQAAVLYVLRILVARPLPLNDGCLEPVELILRPESVVNPHPGRAVAAGNVETSQRVVDVLLGALGLSAACQGTMNNLSFGNDSFGYYETIAGGTGAGALFGGASAVHSHMTNTRITDGEVLEARFPVRLREFSVRKNSGGSGRHQGGDGVVREFETLAALDLSLLTDRRLSLPFGLAGGGSALGGRNLVNGKEVPGRFRAKLPPGTRIRIETPGGGGYGAPST